MADRYNISKFISKLCNKSCSYEIDMEVLKELERLEMGNREEVNQNLWDEYCQDVHNISDYIQEGEFREMKPDYQPLIDKFEE